MPRLSKTDEAQLEDVREALGQMLEVVGVLEASGLTQGEVAEQMGVNQGYLSSTTGKLAHDPEAVRVSTKKLEEMVRGLRRAVDARELELQDRRRFGEANAPLVKIEERWGWGPRRIVAPGGVVRSDHANLVRRTCDGDLQGRIGEPTTLLVHGPPQSGRSSLVLRAVEVARRKGVAVAVADVTTAPTPTSAGMCQVVAQAVDEDADGCTDWRAVDGVIDNWFESSGAASHLLVLDGVGTGPAAVARDVVQHARDWHNRRGRGTVASRPWARLAVWVVSTSVAVEDTRYLSAAVLMEVGSASMVDTRWFTYDEVGTLVDAYATSRQLKNGRAAVVGAVHGMFNGQPALTHEAVAAWQQGRAPKEWLDPKALPGSVHAHLRHVGGLVAANPTCKRLVLAAASGKKTEEWSPLLVELGVLDAQSEWTCELYREHLPRYATIASGGARDGEEA